MKKTMISVCALLLVGATGTMTAGAQATRTLAVFVVGDNTISSPLTTALGANLTSGGRYALTGVSIGSKLTELQATYAAGGGSSINRDALAEWGRTNNISAICLVVDDKNGNDHLFSAQLIDAKDSKLSGKGSYVRTSVAASDATRVALALAQQLVGSGRKRSAPAPARSYPAELDIEMVFVEGGTFQMGCQDNECISRELPVHSITVSSFYIGKYEITRAQWIAAMKNHPVELLRDPGRWKSDDQLPIESACYNDIVGTAEVEGFLTYLNRLTGKKYRLPTEAEWEYAARGGKHKNSYKYSGSDNVGEVAWWGTNAGAAGNSGGVTHIVGGKKPNALGIYDMTGNVWEFCSDWSADNYYSTTSSGATNPTGPLSGTIHMIRGGAWDGVSNQQRVAFRNNWSCNDTRRDPYFGFRVVLPAQ
jgi:formylglycine-generating enzyme required for sulfatase activity